LSSNSRIASAQLFKPHPKGMDRRGRVFRCRGANGGLDSEIETVGHFFRHGGLSWISEGNEECAQSVPGVANDRTSSAEKMSPDAVLPRSPVSSRRGPPGPHTFHRHPLPRKF